MVVLTINLNLNKKSFLIKDIENILLDAVGRKGFYADINNVLNHDEKIKLNGKKTKKILICNNELEAVKKIEKIKDDHILIIYDLRYYCANIDQIMLFIETISEIKPKKITIISIINEDFDCKNESIIKIKNNQSVEFVESKRENLLNTIADAARKIAQQKAIKKIRKFKNELEKTAKTNFHEDEILKLL